MNSVVHKAIVLSALGALCFAGCGGSDEQSEKPKVAAKPKAEQKVLPGEKEFADATAAAEAGKWEQAAKLFDQAAKLLAEALEYEPAPQPKVAAKPAGKGGAGQGKAAAAKPAAPKRKALTPEEKERVRGTVHAAVVNRGIALERAGKLKEAQAIYKKVLADDKENPKAAANLARVQIALQEYKPAKKTMKAALAHSPENPELLIMLAGVLRQNKEYSEASETARKVLLRDQQNAAATKTLALVYADEGKLQLAETFFRNALKLDDKDPNIRVNLGLIAYKRGEHQKAILEFEEALELDPDNGAALANIGAISLKFRDYARAAQSYEKAVSAGMLSCTTASALGYALEGLQEGEKAVEQLGKAHTMCPKDDELLFTMGMICMAQLRDNQCALKNFEAYSKAKENLAKDHRVFSFIEGIKQQLEFEKAGPQEAPPEEPPAEAPPAEETAAAGEGAEASEAAPESGEAAPPQSENDPDGRATERRAERDSAAGDVG